MKGSKEKCQGPEEISCRLVWWVRQVGSLHGDPFLGLEDLEERSPVGRGRLLRTDPYHGLQWGTREQWGVEGWEGPLDEQARWHGRGLVRLPEGGEVAGVWREGHREGRASTTAPAEGILSLVGEYRQGRLGGLVKLLRYTLPMPPSSLPACPGRTVA